MAKQPSGLKLILQNFLNSNHINLPTAMVQKNRFKAASRRSKFSTPFISRVNKPPRTSAFTKRKLSKYSAKKRRLIRSRVESFIRSVKGKLVLGRFFSLLSKRRRFPFIPRGRWQMFARKHQRMLLRVARRLYAYSRAIFRRTPRSHLLNFPKQWRLRHRNGAWRRKRHNSRQRMKKLFGAAVMFFRYIGLQVFCANRSEDVCNWQFCAARASARLLLIFAVTLSASFSFGEASILCDGRAGGLPFAGGVSLNFSD